MKAKYKAIEVEYVQFTNTPENLKKLEMFFSDKCDYEVDNENADEPELRLGDFDAAYLNDYVVYENNDYYVIGEVEFNKVFEKIE